MSLVVKFEDGSYYHPDHENGVSQTAAKRYDDLYQAWQVALDAYNASCGSERPRVVKLIPSPKRSTDR